MRRREFITLVGAAATALPLTAWAQQPAMRVVGILGAGSPGTDAFRAAAVRQGLKETGYVEGHNVAFEYRWAEDRYEQLPALAAELVRQKVDVIVAIGGNTSAVAAKSATSTIPIVFEIGGDPIELGLVASLSRPGGNITGVTFLVGTLTAKQLEILHETVPKAALIGFLLNPANADAEIKTKDALAGAAAVGQKLLVVPAHTDSELESAFVTFVQRRAGALVISAEPFFSSRRDKLIELAARQKLPAIYSLREFVTAGGLMSYGTSLTEALRLAGLYAGRILKGEKPADLPVQQSAKVELVINLKIAKTLGITVPTQIVARADEVIE
jgi:putative ABC transport system substrate-binding protein